MLYELCGVYIIICIPFLGLVRFAINYYYYTSDSLWKIWLVESNQLTIIAWSLNFSRLLLSLVSGERRLKALGDNAVRWCHESNVVIYEISNATFSAKTSLDKTVKFWWTSIISASLSTVCKIYKNSLKLCIGPMIKLSFYFQYARLAH